VAEKDLHPGLLGFSSVRLERTQPLPLYLSLFYAYYVTSITSALRLSPVHRGSGSRRRRTPSPRRLADPLEREVGVVVHDPEARLRSVGEASVKSRRIHRLCRELNLGLEVEALEENL
jgi:hypothetical protein